MSLEGLIETDRADCSISKPSVEKETHIHISFVPRVTYSGTALERSRDIIGRNNRISECIPSRIVKVFNPRGNTGEPLVPEFAVVSFLVKRSARIADGLSVEIRML